MNSPGRFELREAKINWENEELKQLLTKDKTIENLRPLIHSELKDIIRTECNDYRKTNNTEAVSILNKFAFDLGIIEAKEIL